MFTMTHRRSRWVRLIARCTVINYVGMVVLPGPAQAAAYAAPSAPKPVERGHKALGLKTAGAHAAFPRLLDMTTRSAGSRPNEESGPSSRSELSLLDQN